jgi:hypothetical protein
LQDLPLTFNGKLQRFESVVLDDKQRVEKATVRSTLEALWNRTPPADDDDAGIGDD